MKTDELPTDRIESYTWGYILPLPEGTEPTGYDDTFYSGTYSVLDGAKVQDVTAEQFARIDGLFHEGGDWAEQNIALLIELVDGGWVTCLAWCDSSGFGCQQDVQWKWAPTRELAISQGLDREARQKLGLSLPEDAR